MAIGTTLGILGGASALGNIAGGLISGGGASAAGSAALANSRELAQENRDALSPFTAAGGDAASILNALSGLGYLTPDGHGGSYATGANWRGDLSDAQNRALASIKGGPLLSLAQPYLDQYAGNVGTSFTASPSYQFRLTQGQNALNNSGAANGMTFSGPQAKALTDYNQQSASQEYANWLNNYTNYANTALSVNSNAANSYINGLYNLSGQGASAAASANNSANSAMIPGINAMAGGQATSANALGSGIAGGLNNLAALGAFGGLGGGSGTINNARNLAAFGQAQGGLTWQPSVGGTGTW